MPRGRQIDGGGGGDGGGDGDAGNDGVGIAVEERGGSGGDEGGRHAEAVMVMEDEAD